MSDITFLDEKQIIGEDQLEIFKKYGTKSAITDFSILLGGKVSYDYHTSEGNLLKDRVGWYWTLTCDGNNDARAVNVNGFLQPCNVYNRCGGNRPTLPYSSIKTVSWVGERDKNGLLEVIYGEYPQTIADEDLSDTLENLYESNSIEKTGKVYTTDSQKYDDYNSQFKPRIFEEYVSYTGRKFIRFVGDYNCKSEILSDGRIIEGGMAYWVKVEPIVWLVDEKADIAVTKKLIFSGVQFKNTHDYDGNFENTDIKKFIDNHFSKDILDNQIDKLQKELLSKNIELLSRDNYKCASAVLDIPYCSDLAKLSGYDTRYVLLSDLFNPTGMICGCVYNLTKELHTTLPVSEKYYGIRPTIYYGNETYIKSNGKKIDDTTYEINIGEFPQSAVSDYENTLLNSKLANGELVVTGKHYTFDDEKTSSKDPFKPYPYDEYLDKEGNKYIRYFTKAKPTISRTLNHNMHRWIKVEPLTWYYNTQEKLLYTKNVIVSGIRCGDKVKKFANTEVYMYLNYIFKQEVFTNSRHIKAGEFLETIEEKAKAKKKDNVYDFNLERVDEEDIIKGCIEGDIPVFLHGQSSEGKSARVKQIDPDCTILYLSNATPESLNGKSVYDPNKGEIVDVAPSWYTKLVNKCEAEPDKVHVLFFDELTNALPSIQGMAFNIILDREVNGVWKLPTNCRIAASGNDMDESLAANELAKPLFNRLAHVYIKTTVPNWLNWASKNNIHPAIYAFVAYNGEKVLRTEYNGEKPHADPRRWEMASKMLYSTNNPHLLRGIIGEGVTAQLVAFCKQTVITLEDVLNHNYTKEDLKMNIGQKYMTAVGLSLVDEKNLKEVREFTYSLGSEIGAVFDSMWSHGDVEKIIKLAELEATGGIKR